MAKKRPPVPVDLKTRFRGCGINGSFQATPIRNLSDFFGVFSSLINSDDIYWFRGHADLAYELTPSALRYKTEDERSRALDLLDDMRRFLEIKLQRPPLPDQWLKWMQVAQHYGLPTRLLDWTQSAVVALYFACERHSDKDGVVVAFKPIELNSQIEPTVPRVFNDDRDREVLARYAGLDGRLNPRGPLTAAIIPTWNNERIVLQQGCFTLHGSRHFTLDSNQASSLVYVPVLREHKETLRRELERAGISEMFIFPEAEHLCSHLKWKAKL